jgi:hypothetical protein
MLLHADGTARGEWAAALPLYMLIILIIVAIAVFIFYLWLLQYIYKDATKRDLNGELWLIILLIAPIVGIIVYFIVRKSKART